MGLEQALDQSVDHVCSPRRQPSPTLALERGSVKIAQLLASRLDQRRGAGAGPIGLAVLWRLLGASLRWRPGPSPRS